MDEQMASPGVLVRKISQAMGIPEATVASTHRYLRDAGLITKGGRGNSSAKMTPLDAANLIISLLASNAINDSPEVVRRYGGLALRIPGLVCNIPEIDPHAEAGTFAEGLSQVLMALADGEIANAVSKATNEEVSNSDLNYNNAVLAVKIFRPATKASIEIDAIIGKDHEIEMKTVLKLEYELNFTRNEEGKLRIPSGFSVNLSQAGLNECRWVELAAMQQIAASI